MIRAFLISASLWGGTVAAQDNNLMLTNGQKFIDTPYVAHTLEVNREESLVINCKEVDCTTFVEYTLAMSLCSQQGDTLQESEFARKLQRIRYRDGKIDGYTSRLHYISDWIQNGVNSGFLEEVTAANSPYVSRLAVSYMSTHPKLYKQLTNSPENVAQMVNYEQALTGRKIHWIPKEMLPTTGLPWIKSGDIIAITTNTPGLEITHMGIALYIEGNLCLMHASYKKGKVVVESQPLSHMLERNSHWTGIRVVRMKQ